MSDFPLLILLSRRQNRWKQPAAKSSSLDLGIIKSVHRFGNRRLNIIEADHVLAHSVLVHLPAHRLSQDLLLTVKIVRLSVMGTFLGTCIASEVHRTHRAMLRNSIIFSFTLFCLFLSVPLNVLRPLRQHHRLFLHRQRLDLVGRIPAKSLRMRR